MSAGVAKTRSAASILAPAARDDGHGTQASTGETNERLRRFMQAYWLRPENAVWMTLRSLALGRVAFGHPCIDVSCGDGLFSFLHFGGALEPDFDVFGSVGPTEGPHSATVDMFDHVTDDYRPAVTSTARRRVDVGTDLKRALLAKAERLDFYDRLVRHDNNERLPFDDGTFATVYCNSAYWVDRIDTFLSELRRITRGDGRVVLQVKLEAMRRFTLDRYESVLGRGFLEILGRRVDCWPTLADRGTWEGRFARAGWCVDSVTPFVTGTHAHLWDVGLRPVAPLLIRMANGLAAADRAAVKRDWVAMFCELAAPLIRPDLGLPLGGTEAAEVQYVLKHAPRD